MSYHHFTKEERVELQTLLKQNYSYRYIADIIGKNVSSISREVSRNKDQGHVLDFNSNSGSNSSSSSNYSYSVANKKALKRRNVALRLRIKIVPDSELEEYILKKLKLNWSPEQIAGRIKEEQTVLKLPLISYQTIYEYIYLSRPDLKKYLRIISVKGKYRRRYGTRVRERLREKEKKLGRMIDDRDKNEIIENRKRLGDFEGDTIVGAEKSIHILTHVDRKSGFLVADKAEDITAEGVRNLTLNSFKKLPKSKVKSITYDNGVQFSKFEDTENRLRKSIKNQKFSIYFAHPYHSWERGTNENTNGLLRQYFPKKSLFKNITRKQLDKKVKLINSRPRKRLNYLTPDEVFKNRVKEHLKPVLRSLNSGVKSQTKFQVSKLSTVAVGG